MPRGKIKTFVPDRGFGFITADEGGQDVFFHQSKVNDMGYTVEQGAPVEYEAKPGKRPGKLEAVSVRLLGFAPEEPAKPARGPGAGRRKPTAGAPTELPAECIFDSFYGEDGYLQRSLAFEASESAAAAFSNAGLKGAQLRKLFIRFRAFALPLSLGKIPFPKAIEDFGAFYAEGVVRQHNRTDQGNRPLLPHVVKEFIDKHKDVIQQNERETFGFLKYLTYILCYFVDPKKKRS